ncbi:MAG: hypothetical protein M3295_06465, partial [Chloroflexota bacterium]|nr:hypothetical protein [Chloroflexota bacterium]
MARDRYRVRLKRDLGRMLVLPLLLVALGVAGVAGALTVLDPPTSLATAGLSAVLGFIGVVLVLYLTSIRLYVLPGVLRVTTLTRRHDYRLVPGAVTRVVVPRRGRSPVEAGLGVFGIAFGRGRLRSTESVSVVRLGRTDALIVVPTDRGRVVVAPAQEVELLDVLRDAARPLEPAVRPIAAPPRPTRPLTGIERARLEEERLAAIAAQEAARQAELDRIAAERQAVEEARRAELERIAAEQRAAEEARRAAIERAE